ncbi:MAG: NADH-quinone oxidoreductase subunit C [Actinobacteria bacterium]|nr:NADH-quinone oxidoreductase subunit C [Actinomycetota bacterium]
MSLQVGNVRIGADELAARLARGFAGDLTDLAVQEPDTVVARLSRDKVKDVARRLHDLDETPVDSLTLISSVDYVTHLECVYHLYSYAADLYVELHVELPRGTPTVATVSDVWPGADWHEREAWDMMGIVFEGHPDPRRILLKDDWIGHPLRKDYVDDVRNHPYV